MEDVFVFVFQVKDESASDTVKTVMNCYNQRYEGTSVMSGIRNGV